MTSNKPTLDEILAGIRAEVVVHSYPDTSFKYNHAKLSGKRKAKQQLTQLIADIVTEPNGNMMPPTIADGIRQRAKERGIDLDSLKI